MKSISETKAIRIYPMKDSACGIMWKIHPPKACLDKFDEEDWAKDSKAVPSYPHSVPSHKGTPCMM